MEAAAFERFAVERLEPVLRPHGFPFDPQSGGFSLLFHCDGDDVDRLRERWPRWFAEVAAVHAPDEVICLDLWVERTRHPTQRFGDRWDFTSSAATSPPSMPRSRPPAAESSATRRTCVGSRADADEGARTGRSGRLVPAQRGR